jgi:hypothetical protein
VTIRDPYDRTISALLYHHPNNANVYHLQQTTRQQQLGPVAYQCFPTLEKFANLLHRGNATNCHYPYRHNVIEPKDCQELACATIHGKVRFFTHLFFNYRNILYTKLPPHRQIYVIRQEHLWDDWQQLNQHIAVSLLSNVGDVTNKTHHDWQQQQLQKQSTNVSISLPSLGRMNMESQRNVTGIQLPVTRQVSWGGRQKLCRALETEYRAYFQLLSMAMNMKENDIHDSFRIATKNCPHLVNMSSQLLGSAAQY